MGVKKFIGDWGKDLKKNPGKELKSNIAYGLGQENKWKNWSGKKSFTSKK